MAKHQHFDELVKGRSCVANNRRLQVVWIDDLVDAESAECCELSERGFDVTCVQTGQSGLRAIERARFDNVILDINLPDVCGLDLLERLTIHSPHAPVVVLTGVGLMNDAIVAMKLGAADFKCKPIATAALVDLLQTVAVRRTPVSAEPLGEEEWLAIQTDRLGYATTRDEAAAGVTRLILSERVSLRWFLACVQAFRVVITSNEPSLTILIAHMRAAIRAGNYVRWPSHPKLVHALTALEGTQKKQGQTMFANAAGLSRSYLSRRLHSETGRHSREWTQDAVVRAAFRRLVQTPESVSQIAFDLGYEHVSQFDREFRRVFGLSPSSLRRLPFLRPRPGCSDDTPR